MPGPGGAESQTQIVHAMQPLRRLSYIPGPRLIFQA